ncbi:MAG: isoleucine--tRNA ligase [Proteobacteria bacterium]|nr:isoleucine--tRNA ligase [Pseudomonadota bacterium]
MYMDFKNTVFLPQTSFAMKAGLNTLEVNLLNHWKETNLYQKIRKKSKGKKKFILHYGPPYANGNIHIGHALTSILKDIVVKTKQMQGYDAPLVPGWDCHGLPIEWKIEEQYKEKGLKKDEVDPIELIASCRSFAKKWVDIQREEFKRLGIVADWDNPYITMDFATEGKIVEEISKFLLNGTLYRGLKPVLWSVVEKTALADAETEYKDHTSDSIYVKFKIQNGKGPLESAYAVIWTTTPWTLPGNRAISFGPDFKYSVISINNEKYLVAEDLLQNFLKATEQTEYQKIASLKGTELEGLICQHPFYGEGYDFDVPFLPGDHVTTEAGTGLVHTAPGHGEDDFNICKTFNIPVPETVKGDGFYFDHVPLFKGVHIFKANPVVMDKLTEKNALLSHSKLVHSYPHSWRSKAPLIYRATPQWFVKIDPTIREIALSEIEKTDFFPEKGKTRIQSMVQNRPDWCLSRQRVWGVPLAFFVHNETGEPLRCEKVQNRIIDAISKNGVEAWITMNSDVFLANDYSVNDYSKVTDIADVWFDSGATHAYVLQARAELAWPADLYLEGSDQHRGWFQSSLLESSGTMQKAPYKAILTHGFTLDEKGHKMSKSLGNVIAPQDVIEKMGADILRLWVVNSDYTEDQRIGNEILKQQEDIYRRFRNTLRYLLGALSGFNETESINYDEMPILEKWILHRLTEIDQLHKEAIENYELMHFYSHLHAFCSQDLSAFYFDIRKDSLYCDSKNSVIRRSARTVMDSVLNALIRYLAPVLSFTAEEAWFAYKGNQESSIHEEEFLTIDNRWKNNSLGDYWKKVRHLRRVMTTALEVERQAKSIGSSLQAQIFVYVTAELAQVLEKVDIAELAITSKATLVIATPPSGALMLDDVEDVGVVVAGADGQKCQRCWKILPEVGDLEREHKEVCHRCEDVIFD